MLKPTFGANFAVFVLFFGASALDAFYTRDFARALLWITVALVFLRADGKVQRGQPSAHRPGIAAHDRGYTLMHPASAPGNCVEVVLGEGRGRSSVRRVLSGVTAATLDCLGDGEEQSLHVTHIPREAIISVLPEPSRLSGIS